MPNSQPIPAKIEGHPRDHRQFDVRSFYKFRKYRIWFKDPPSAWYQ